ncbi:DUF4838 domain-containing protein [Candidatus Woesearchaeota archaeon]|nr:DUF4838 domain-containing protein [Candidatus Woesearchaeota archaeon]
MRVTISLFLLVLLPLACAVPHADYPSFSSAEGRFSLIDGELSVVDDVLFRGGYVSVGGGAWQPVTLAGEPYGSSADWLSSGASLDLSSFSFPSDKESYIIVYSCSQAGGWDCHATTSQPDGFWQLFVIGEPTPPSGTLYLVKDGVAQADIVISPEAPNLVAMAADELQLHVERMTGASLPINNVPSQDYGFHVYIGRSTYTDALGVTDESCQYGSYKKVSGDDYLVLLGNDDLQSVSGPHSVRWSSETATVLEEWDDITGEYWGTPYQTYYKDHDPDHEIWETDGRGTMNAVVGFLYDQGVRWYYPGEIGTIIPDKQDIFVETMDEHVRPDFAMRQLYEYYNHFNMASEDELYWQLHLQLHKGDDVIGRSHGHGISLVTGRDEVKQAHPEYYAIWGGELMNGDNQKEDLCSQALLEENVAFVRKFFDVYGDVGVSVMPSDGFTYASERTDECKAQETRERGYEGWLSDYVFEYVNNVAWEVYETHPDKIITCDAYTTYLLPPTSLSKPIAPNLHIIMARWRAWFTTPERRDFYRQVTDDWLEILPSNQVYVWDYYLHNRLDRATESYPAVFPQIISEDLKYLKGKSGGEYIEILKNWGGWNLDYDPYAANALNVWVTARLYWDADQDVDLLLEEYYDLYYGPAADQMQAFVKYAEEHLAEAGEESIHLVNLRNMAEEARMIAGDTVYGERIDLLLGLMNSRYVGEEALISSCQTLDSPSTTYKLSKDVTTTGTCFTIATDGVTLDCQGHTITYGTGGEGQGLVIDGENEYTIKNCDIRSGSATASNAIYLHGTRTGTIAGNTITVANNGIRISGADNTTIKDNTIVSTAGIGLYAGGLAYSNITGNDISGEGEQAFYLYGSHDVTIEDNDVTSNNGRGLWMNTGGNNTLTNNKFTSQTTYALWLYQTTNNHLVDNTATSTNGIGLRLYSGADDNLVVGQSATGASIAIEVANNEGNTFQDCREINGEIRDTATGTTFINCPH